MYITGIYITGIYVYYRDLYYQDVQLYGSQGTVDHIVDNISCMLGVPRWQLHVVRDI